VSALVEEKKAATVTIITLLLVTTLPIDTVAATLPSLSLSVIIDTNVLYTLLYTLSQHHDDDDDDDKALDGCRFRRL
jgi:hypothetical protein